ncbi:transmembrane protein, putative [Medicago truncatula]|uniref:Transmembrane protein, putative n=1 Tax=Medicago truncatula TaxID=3880 RepID=G7KNJ2_MEDTR|nr:transmembrane protein, putative [Medicago truncatula]
MEELNGFMADLHSLSCIPVFVGSNLGYFDSEKKMQILSILMTLCQVVVVEMDLLLFLLTTMSGGRAVKTDGPTRLGPALTGFGLSQKTLLKNGLEY